MGETNEARRHRLRGTTELDRRLKQQARAERRCALDRRPFGRMRRRLGWPLAALGITLFAASYLGAVTGADILPFDRHHVIGQLGGGLLAMVGFSWATAGAVRRPKR